MIEAKYKFTKPGTLLFITGVPFSGKSTVAPLVAASIKGSSLQCMDIFRLIAQEIETAKPKNLRNPFVQFGSCDSYLAIGDGSYTNDRLITGFNNYSEVVCSLLQNVIPKLEVQGAREVIFEGVQLTPTIVEKYLKGNNKLIILASNISKLTKNRDEVLADEKELLKRYLDERLMLIQKEIRNQSKKLPKNRFLVVENTGSPQEAVQKILNYLLSSRVIVSTNDRKN